eukprot:433261-Prorocentrum_lima.AAC.1
MTSSLVGSEMCIRDSKDSILLRGALPIPTLGVFAPNASTFVRVVVWVPVSYTHLTLPTICSV